MFHFENEKNDKVAHKAVAWFCTEPVSFTYSTRTQWDAQDLQKQTMTDSKRKLGGRQGSAWSVAEIIIVENFGSSVS